MRGIGLARRMARRAWLWPQAKALVVVYHRVADLDGDPQLLAVSPARFAAQLDCLRASAAIVTLRDLAAQIRDGRVRDRSVAITFDDGYADNETGARPVLERFGAPATVFVTSGAVGTSREFWWDELERIILRRAALPPALAIRLPDGEHRWSVAGGPAAPSWNVLMPPHSSRERCYVELQRLLQPLSAAGREDALDQIARWAGDDRSARPGYRALSAEQLARLAGSRLIAVGAHTVTHPLLSAQPERVQWTEIADSRRQLEARLGRPVTAFAYPFGGRMHGSAATEALAERAGFEVACANEPGVVTRRSRLWWVPRVIVRDWPADVFRQQVTRWFRG